MGRTRSLRSSTAWLVAVGLCLGLLVPVIATAGPDENWVSGDIGESEPPGSFAHAGNEYVVRGAGTGLNGTADSLHYARQAIVGDAVVVAKVEDLSAGSEEAHAGVMIRGDESPEAAHASFVVVDDQVALRYRDAAGSPTVEITDRPPPGWKGSFWLRLERKGSTFTAEISNNGRGWRDVGSVQFTLNDTVLVGVAASNAGNGQVATATFSDVVVEGQRPEPEEEPEPDSSPEPDPEPTEDTEPGESLEVDSDSILTGEDIGSPTPDGSTVEDDGTLTIEGAGTDIWGRSDSFHYAWKEITGDVEILAKVTSQTNTHSWAKAGIMLRDGLAADARHASVFVTPSSGTALQHRPVTGGDSHSAAGPDTSAPYWVRIQRVGETIVGAVSADGSNWTEVGRLSLSMPDDLLVGLAVTSRNDGTLSTATFTDLHINSIEDTEVTAPGWREGTSDATRLGLHVTAEELEVWRDRWVNGVAGDSFLNARISAEKDEIINDRDAFRSDPDGQLWTLEKAVLDSSGCVRGGRAGIGQENPRRMLAIRTQRTALYALIHQDAVLMEKVRDQLAKQPDQTYPMYDHNGNRIGSSDLDFTRSHWCGDAGAMRAAGDPGFRISHSMVSSLLTYDYVSIAIDQGLIADWSAAERSKLRDWYLGFASYVHESPRSRMDQMFVDWDNGDFTLQSFAAEEDNLWNSPNTYRDGPEVHRMHNQWNNRVAASIRFVGLAGIAFDHATYRDFATNYFESMIRFAVYPHGAASDMHRGWNNMRSGLGYMGRQFALAMTFVDALARTGDTSLYDFTTTEGSYDTAGAPSAHGPNPESAKSFEFFALALTRYSDRTYQRYNGQGERYDFQAAITADSPLRRSDQLILGNLYWQHPKIRDFYRGDGDMHTWSIDSTHSNRNDSGAHPAPYLMWADLEGHIRPYPTP